jgi:uncharacterized protein (TIGR03032 family)
MVRAKRNQSLNPNPDSELKAMWSRHHTEWREPSQITSQWQEAAHTDPRSLQYKVRGAWWEILAAKEITLIVTREYEHLVMAINASAAGPRISYMRLPHPSGLAVDRARKALHIVSTRNPNQVVDLMPVTGALARLDVKAQPQRGNPLVPVRSRFFPGCLYMHDLALIGGELYANAVGQNAIVRLDDAGRHKRVWWPRCIETNTGPVFGQNHIQLNSIAAGANLKSCYFSASTDKISARRPGHKNFPVDKRGVIFSGATREPIARGLTRPHSARLHRGKVWLDNSGYGEFGVVDGGQFTRIAHLPGWTRGLCLHDRVAFVGTSCVIPRFRQYAPGLNVDTSRCGLHAVDLESGRVLGSLIWPNGNQIFGIDWMSSRLTTGFPFSTKASRSGRREKNLFYTFTTGSTRG